MFPEDPPAFVLGGRFGDIIQMLPCFREIHRRSGRKPFVISSSEYVSVYDGVSYVDHYRIEENWYTMVPKAKQIAESMHGDAVVVQFWNTEPAKDDTIGFNGRPWATLQCHGHNHGVDMAMDPDYGTSMARRCGFSREEWVRLPLVFDRRNAEREANLAKSVLGHEKKPVLLFNTTGISSPFVHAPELVQSLLRDCGRQFRLVDLSKVSGYRIFDLLGLYDRSSVLVTTDTSTAHLAPASKIPTVWLTVDGWTRSVPKGNVLYHCSYSEFPQHREAIIAAILSIAHGPVPSLVTV